MFPKCCEYRERCQLQINSLTSTDYMCLGGKRYNKELRGKSTQVL